MGYCMIVGSVLWCLGELCEWVWGESYCVVWENSVMWGIFVMVMFGW